MKRTNTPDISSSESVENAAIIPTSSSSNQVDWWRRPNEKKPVKVKIRYKNPKGSQPKSLLQGAPQLYNSLL